MICTRCNSDNVSVQMLTEQELKQRGHGLVYWLLIGWWLQPLLWIFLTLPMIIITIFKPRRYAITCHTKKMAVCNNCGNSWEL